MSAAARRDPAATAEAALLLLARGRPDMVRRVLEPLPGLVRAAVASAYAAGRDAGVRAAGEASGPAAPAGGGRPAFSATAALLEGHVRRLGVRRVAEELGVRIGDLGPLLEGRVGVSRAVLDKLRRARE